LKKIHVKSEKCSGCRICELVCSFHHEGRFNPRLSRIAVVKEDKYGLDYPVFCHQCKPCPVIAACPSYALKRGALGVIYVDEEACTKCGICVNACLFDAIPKNEASRPLICDLCGGEPRCVEKCPTKALVFTDSKLEFNRSEEEFQKLLERWGIIG
jgi:carbon-monoxide dehydrogenase iron sulfur subunit